MLKQRADFLSALVYRRYPFRRAAGWPTMAVRMLAWGLSAATVLHVLERRYTQAGM